ncbi:MAG: hypothetical protein LBU58_04990 [Clostridiales bacterium]|nr:hypothetical protein [Clostridiales bacterium]
MNRYALDSNIISYKAVAKLRMFERLCASNIVGDINRDVLDMAVDIHVTLRRAGRMIEDADILIAATPFGL